MKKILPTWQYNTFINWAQLSFWYACFNFTWCTYRGITLFKNLSKIWTLRTDGKGVCYTGVKILLSKMKKSTLHWHHSCPASLATVVLCKNSTAGGSAENSLSLYGEKGSWGNERCKCSWVPWTNRPVTSPFTQHRKKSFGQPTHVLIFPGLLLGEVDLAGKALKMNLHHQLWNITHHLHRFSSTFQHSNNFTLIHSQHCYSIAQVPTKLWKWRNSSQTTVQFNVVLNSSKGFHTLWT